MSRHRIDRRSFIHANVSSLLAVHAVVLGSIGELLRPKHPHGDTEAPHLDRHGLEQLIRATLENVSITERSSPTCLSDDRSAIDPLEMASAAIERMRSEDISTVAYSAFTWANNYQLSYEEAEQVQNDVFDCNDEARYVCEKLSHRGIPMYLLSIWPTHPRARLHHSWHQMAACKLGPQYYCIIDHAQHAIFWRGNLAEFVREYSRGQAVPMSIIPGVGIARYIEPQHDIAPAKFLLQLVHMQREEDMRSLGISPRRPDATRLAQR